MVIVLYCCVVLVIMEIRVHKVPAVTGVLGDVVAVVVITYRRAKKHMLYQCMC